MTRITAVSVTAIGGGNDGGLIEDHECHRSCIIDTAQVAQSTLKTLPTRLAR